MGFSLGKTIGTAAGGLAAGPAGLVAGNYIGGKIEEKLKGDQKRKLMEDLANQENEAKSRMIDPRIREQASQQLQQSQGFRANMGNVRKDLTDQGTAQSRVDLAQKMKDVRQGSNSRGLLYSGLRQSGEMGAQGQAANQMANQNVEINQGLEDQARQYEGAALNADQSAAETESALADQISGLDVRNQQDKNKQIASIGGAVGGAAGVGAGLLSSPKAPKGPTNAQKAQAFNNNIDSQLAGMNNY